MEGHEIHGIGEEEEQRRILAAQLQEKLDQDQQQLANKEQQNELLKSKLSLIKSRSKAKRESAEKDGRLINAANDGTDASPKQGDAKLNERKHLRSKSNKGKINVLREQLEQNRLRFERHGQQLTEDARSMEAVVEQLRHKLEDSDVTIQQLQAGQLLPIAASANEQESESGDVDSQLAEKEALVHQLMAQTTNLQHTVLELQENLKEKDCVIEARTRAITLLSEDMSKKWRANVDMLEETRQQMHIMQENFVSIEAGLNKEIEQLNQQLENKSKKLLQVEHSLKQTESARFDLATRNAELQEKIVSLQGQTQGGSALKEAQLKIDELSQALSDANRLAVKLKAEHKTKVKALKIQIDSLRKESGSIEEIARLQNYIAVLEEEKATQADHLEHLEKTVAELQNLKVASEIRLVETEDQVNLVDFEQVVSDLKLKLEDRDKEIYLMKEKLHNAEVKNKEDQASLISDMKHEIMEARSALKEWQMRCEALETELNDQQRNLRSHSNHDFVNEAGREIPDEDGSPKLQALHFELKEKELELKALKEKHDTIETSLLSRVESLESNFLAKRQQIQELEAIIQANVEKIQSNYFVESLASHNTHDEIYELRNVINERENHIKYLEDVVKTLRKDLEEYETLKVNFTEISHELAQVRDNISCSTVPLETKNSCELCKDVANLQMKLVEISGELELKREECCRLEAKLKTQDEKLKKVAVNLKVKAVTNKELEDRVSKFEKIIEAKEAQVEDLSREKLDLLEKWQAEVSEKTVFISQAVADLGEKDQVIEDLKADLDSKASALSAMNLNVNSLQAELDSHKIMLQEKCKSLEEVLENTSDHHVTATQMDSLQTELSLLQEQLSKETEEKQAAITKLESFTKNVKLKLAKEKKIRNEMQEKQVELEGVIAEKSKVIDEIHEKYQHDLANLHQEISALQIQRQEIFTESKHDIIETDKSSLALFPQNLVEDFSPPPSLETFEVEIENLCSSLSETSGLEILPILEEEKKKTLDELQSRFDVIHSQMISRLNHTPDLQGERKLFTELQNLVIRVTNRTAVLEKKTQKIITDFEEHMKKKVSDAQFGIQSLENIVSELKEQLHQMESERIHLEEVLKQLSQEKCDTERLFEDERQRSSKLESEIVCLHQELREITSSLQNLEYDLQEKDNAIGSLHAKCQEKESASKALQDHVQERDLLILNLQTQIQNGEALVSALQAQILDKEFENENLRDEILKRDSMVCALEAQVEEEAAVIASLRPQAQEITKLNNQVLELSQQNLNLEENIKDSRKIEKLLSEAQVEGKETQAKLQQTYEELQEAIVKSTNQERQLAEMTQKAVSSETQLMEASQKVMELEQQLSHNLQLCSDHCSAWNAEKDGYQKRVSELMEHLQQAQLLRNSQELDSMLDENKLNTEDCLRQQLAEKTAEIETYQRRLIQLQMGMADVEPTSFSSLGEPDSTTELTQLRNKVKELQEALENHPTNSNPLMDSFNSASLLFEVSEVSQLKNQLDDVSRELNLLLSEKQNWEKEKNSMNENIHCLAEQLHSSTFERERADAELLSLSELKLKVEAMSSELNTAKDVAKHVNDLQSKIDVQNAETQELQRQLESVKIQKEKAEKGFKVLRRQFSKLEGQARLTESTAGEDRPSIPQTLDTHVSTLQTSDSELYNESNTSEFIHGAMDESLMEQNIIQLESELRGMVTSLLEAGSKQNQNITKDWDWDGKDHEKTENVGITGEALKTSMAKVEALVAGGGKTLLAKLAELESDRNSALSEIAKLQDEIKKLSCSTSQGASRPVTDTSISVDQGWSEEDSWGWGADNAKIEEQHQHKKCERETDSNSLVDELQSKISSLESDNEILEGDKLKLSEDLKASQLRAAKLTRKWKELNAKYNEIVEKNKSSESQFDSLDQAIEEERLKQMQGLEKELKDAQTELASVRAERDKLQKQVDVFSSANERMVEAKERQDVEVEMWQKRSKDLSNQIEALEWRIQELDMGRAEQEASSATQTVESQMHSGSTDALSSIAVDQLLKENHTWNASYETLMQEYQKLRAQHLSCSEHRAQTDAFVAQQKDIIERLEHENSYLQDVYDSLKMDLEEVNAQLASRQDDSKHVTALTENNADLLQKLSESEKKLDETLIKLQELSMENVKLQEQCVVAMENKNELHLDLEHCRKELAENLEEISRLREEVRLLKSNSDNFNNQLAQSVSQNPVLNWNTMVTETGHESSDVFDSLATSSLQNSEQDSHVNDMEVERHVFEALKIAHAEAEQKWNDEITCHKNQLEAAKKTIDELQANLESSNSYTGHKDHFVSQDLQVEQLQTVIFSKEKEIESLQKEIESLQINLAVSEDARKKLENDIMQRNAHVEKVGSSEAFLNIEEGLLSEASSQLAASYSPSGVSFEPSSTEKAHNTVASAEEVYFADNNMLKELDLALYRLHQRDVRCDELTLELTRLLEERDALQLRLSNALRTNEGLRDRLNRCLPGNKDGLSQHQPSPSAVLLSTASSEPVIEQSSFPPPLLPHEHFVPEENNKTGLERKIAEIHEVRYGRDKWLRDDRELRHQQQMQFLYSPSATGSRMGMPNAEQSVNMTIAASSSEDDLHSSDANDSSSIEAQGSLLGWLWGRR